MSEASAGSTSTAAIATDQAMRTSSQPPGRGHPSGTPTSSGSPMTAGANSAKLSDEQLMRLSNLPDASLLPAWEPVCQNLTIEQCKLAKHFAACPFPHFERIMRPWTDPTLGQCSYLNMCYGDPAFASNPSLSGGHAGSKQCRYQHYRLVPPLATAPPIPQPPSPPPSVTEPVAARETEPQWLNMDARKMDVGVLGQFDVILADPPWDIHMMLPYGTLSDDECRHLPIPELQPTWGLLALWVTGRAMDLGRDLFREWGYRRIDEVVWVKVNQLGGLVRTGRTGHWLNHTCEHLLIALKLPPESEFPDRRAPIPWDTDPRLQGFRRGMDGDVVVSEVRETSRKPDEIYGLLERLGPGQHARRLEIFGRKHNVRKGWLTIGNQLADNHIVDTELRRRLGMDRDVTSSAA